MLFKVFRSSTHFCWSNMFDPSASKISISVNFSCPLQTRQSPGIPSQSTPILVRYLYSLMRFQFLTLTVTLDEIHHRSNFLKIGSVEMDTPDFTRDNLFKKMIPKFYFTTL